MIYTVKVEITDEMIKAVKYEIEYGDTYIRCCEANGHTCPDKDAETIARAVLSCLDFHGNIERPQADYLQADRIHG